MTSSQLHTLHPPAGRAEPAISRSAELGSALGAPASPTAEEPTIRRLPDIKPQTAIAALDRNRHRGSSEQFSLNEVAPAVGMSSTFIRKVVGSKLLLTADDVILLLDQDAFRETIVRRSQVLDYLIARHESASEVAYIDTPENFALHETDGLTALSRVAPRSVQCVVTSTPYWGLRIYKESYFVTWADGETCPFGHEQTPEGFLRHTSQILLELMPALAHDASVWWNIMDTFNTRTQIRSNAAEALRAMQGHPQPAWNDYECRRYSAGHSYLKDGEQCLIPGLIAERASRLGYYVKGVITWAKTGSLPEPQNSRVSRALEYILHLSPTRTPKFHKEVFRELPPQLGGRNPPSEPDRLSNVWALSTSNGGNGHGAQFPLALPGRCIALTTSKDDLVLDPFVGTGSTGVAARSLGRCFLGIDVSPEYLAKAHANLARTRVSLLS